MTLQELTARLQTLAHNGYAQHQVYIDLNNFGVHLYDIEDVKFKLKSSVTEDGFISITVSDKEKRFNTTEDDLK